MKKKQRGDVRQTQNLKPHLCRFQLHLLVYQVRMLLCGEAVPLQVFCYRFISRNIRGVFTYHHTTWWVPTNLIVKSYNQTGLAGNLCGVKCSDIHWCLSRRMDLLLLKNSSTWASTSCSTQQRAIRDRVYLLLERKAFLRNQAKVRFELLSAYWCWPEAQKYIKSSFSNDRSIIK